MIKATTDFVRWTPLQTNLVTSADASGFFFTDPQSGLFPRRFYRARLYQGSLPPPALSSGALGFPSGRFGFNLSGVAGQTVIIEASTNLADANWSPLITNTLTTAPLDFSDPASTNLPQRFYRARIQ